MNFDELSNEQKEKVRACKTTKDLLELAKSEGRELTSEELEAVSGGDDWDGNFYTCPRCRSTTIWKVGGGRFQCQDCYYEGDPSEF